MTTGADLAQPWLDPVCSSRLRPVSSEQPLPDPLVGFAEFFAGIGLVRAALGPLGFQALWANDIQRVKKEQYIANHPKDGFVLEDVRKVGGRSLPDGLELLDQLLPLYRPEPGRKPGRPGRQAFGRVLGIRTCGGGAPRGTADDPDRERHGLREQPRRQRPAGRAQRADLARL